MSMRSSRRSMVFSMVKGVNGFVLGEGSWIKGKDLDYNCWIALFDG